MSENKKQYAGNAKIITTQYGDLMKISMTEADVKTLSDNLKNGWVNVVIKERRNPSPSGLTHYVEIDQWQPKKVKEVSKANPAFDEQISLDDLPF